MVLFVIAHPAQGLIYRDAVPNLSVIARGKMHFLGGPFQSILTALLVLDIGYRNINVQEKLRSYTTHETNLSCSVSRPKKKNKYQR